MDLTNVNMGAMREIIKAAIELDMMVQSGMVKKHCTKYLYTKAMHIGISSGLTMVELMQAQHAAVQECQNGYNAEVAFACTKFHLGEVATMDLLKDCAQVAEEQGITIY